MVSLKATQFFLFSILKISWPAVEHKCLYPRVRRLSAVKPGPDTPYQGWQPFPLPKLRSPAASWAEHRAEPPRCLFQSQACELHRGPELLSTAPAAELRWKVYLGQLLRYLHVNLASAFYIYIFDSWGFFSGQESFNMSCWVAPVPFALQTSNVVSFNVSPGSFWQTLKELVFNIRRSVEKKMHEIKPQWGL